MDTVLRIFCTLYAVAVVGGIAYYCKYFLDSIIECCPSCGDPFDDRASQCRPIWSDYHDNIVCVTCKENY
jgi:hypothetical protein